jgi:general secretion pathway protein I
VIRRSTTIRLPRREGGFTLIELVAAFVIFALGFGVLLQILSTCLHTTAQSADYTRAALWAQSLIDMQGVGESLQEGSSSGRFDDKFGWRMNVAKIDPPEQPQTGGVTPGNQNQQGPQITTMGNTIDLYQVELIVSWGTFYMNHNARFVTLRAQEQNQNQNGSGVGLQNPLNARGGAAGRP